MLSQFNDIVWAVCGLSCSKRVGEFGLSVMGVDVLSS